VGGEENSWILDSFQVSKRSCQNAAKRERIYAEVPVEGKKGGGKLETGGPQIDPGPNNSRPERETLGTQIS